MLIAINYARSIVTSIFFLKKVNSCITAQVNATFLLKVCGKGFCHRQSLITHSTLHTGIKPFQCESCGSSFSCIGNLLKHRKTRADTCGLLALTTHRVKHPSTKLKVRINTPANSRLKTIQKQKLLKQKLEALDKQQEQCGKSEEMVSELKLCQLLLCLLVRSRCCTKLLCGLLEKSRIVTAASSKSMDRI